MWLELAIFLTFVTSPRFCNDMPRDISHLAWQRPDVLLFLSWENANKNAGLKNKKQPTFYHLDLCHNRWPFVGLYSPSAEKAQRRFKRADH